MTKNISIKKAAMINAIAKYATVFLQLGFVAILSRILTPKDFGVVAVITVFVTLFQLFADSGFGAGVIQNKELSKDDCNNIFSFSVYLGFVLLIVFIGLSYPISLFYGNEIYVTLGSVLSCCLLFSTWNMIPNALMLKEKRFVAIGIRTFATALISYSISLVIALNGGGVFALVFQSVISSLALFIWNSISVKVRFKFLPRWSSVKKIWTYSIFQFCSQSLNYLNRNLDNLLIGKFLSEESLGYYNKAYTLAGYPVLYLPGVITPVLHPILSDHQDDYNYIYNSYLKLVRFLSLLGCFGAAFCFYASREIVLVAFGEQWELSIIPFAYLSLSLWGQILTNTIGAIYQSIGKTKTMFYSLVVTTVVIVISIIFGILANDIKYVALFVSIAYVANFFISFFVLIKYGFKKSFLSFLLTFKYEALIFAALMALCFIYSPSFELPIVGFLVKFGLMFGVYCVLLIVTKQYSVFTSFLKRKKRKV